ncbi:MAG TPA: energy transducer TonB [Chitinophagaceae bacterium]|nr:energy transducer TonB [Chitinophagaceae bacterium]
MDTNKILSADLLDLIFDDRNKDYGAYELRKTYHTRITKSLVFMGLFVLLTFTGVALATKLETKKKSTDLIKTVTLVAIPDDKEPEPIPEPLKKTEPPQVQTEQFTQIKLVNEEVVDPPPTQDELTDAQIDVATKVGIIDDEIITPQNLDERKGLIDDKINKEPTEPFTKVEVDAKFDGNWEKFLLRNLNAQTPVDNNAPEGNYKVLIQFVVDIDGTVSDIKPITNLGYGLEQEAIRVLKKAKNWEPAIQNGRQVKAYRIQAITFQVTGE